MSSNGFDPSLQRVALVVTLVLVAATILRAFQLDRSLVVFAPSSTSLLVQIIFKALLTTKRAPLHHQRV